jgi:hypothetical protein
VKYAYMCPACGEIEFSTPHDSIQCRCGRTAKRVYSLRVQRSTLKHQGRFDPQVGSYVENNAQFMSKLKEQQDREASELGMDVQLTTVDSRDQEALAELHMTTPEAREADMEGTRKNLHDASV